MNYFEDKKLVHTEGFECIRIIRGKVKIICEVKDLLGDKGGFLGSYTYCLLFPIKLLEEFLGKVQNYAVCDGLEEFEKLEKEYETSIIDMMHGVRNDLKRMKDPARARCIRFHMENLDNAFKRMTNYIKIRACIQESHATGDDDVTITRVVHVQQPIVIDDDDDDFEN